KYKFKIINISSNAVFSNDLGNVYEESSTNPRDSYGKSKLNGEITNNSINIRTSIVGLDPEEHKGILELILVNKEIYGFTNEVWSGATVLQLAKLIYRMMNKNNFSILKEKTNTIHFAPLVATK